MKGSKRNKKEQTFNVYPYLGGYQHFMRKGGQLPRFNRGRAITGENMDGMIGPNNAYNYKSTWNGAVDEFNAINNPNYIPHGSVLGNSLNLIRGAGDLFKTTTGVLSKDNYIPGGKYSKYDESGNLRFGRTKYTNTTDRNALLNTENAYKYMNMSKKEKAEWIKSGGRNTDLWWTPQELSDGTYNYMDLNEDGTPKFDGANFRASIMRNELFKHPDTDESLFAIKSWDPNANDGKGAYVYRNKDGSISTNQQGTQYDIIEDSSGPGGLIDANAVQMNFNFDKGTCSDGVSVTMEDCAAAGANWIRDENSLESVDLASKVTTSKEGEEDVITHQNKTENYDPLKEYGHWVKDTEVIINSQNEINKRQNDEIILPEEQNEEENLKYGGALRRFTWGGGLPRFQGDAGPSETEAEKAARLDDENTARAIDNQVTLPDDIENPADNFTLPENTYSLYDWSGGQFRSDTDPLVQGDKLLNQNEEIDLQPEPEVKYNQDWEEPNSAAKLLNFFKGDKHLNKRPEMDQMTEDMVASIDSKKGPEQPDVMNKYELLGVEDPNKPREAAGVASCSDPQHRSKEACQKAGARWSDPQDMGIDVDYGGGPLQKGWNTVREGLNTGIPGAAQDIFRGASSFFADQVSPFVTNYMNADAAHKQDLRDMSVSSEDMYAAMESGKGAGQKGFHDINKGGIGDDLYGTGAIYGTAQQGQELMQQPPQRDLSGVRDFMNVDDNIVGFDLEFLRKQKNYLGKMNMGGALPRFQGTKKSEVLDLENETKKQKKNRIKNYTHPYLQQYYNEFARKGNWKEKSVRDIMSSMNIQESDTAFVTQSVDQNMIRSINNMKVNQYIGSQMYDKEGTGNWSGSIGYDDKQNYFTTEQDEDGNSWDFITNLYNSPKGKYTGVLKSRKKYGGALPRFQGDDGSSETGWFNKGLDYLQTGLTGAGLTPGYGIFADAFNTGVSGARAGYSYMTGDKEGTKTHTENMALNATSAIPGPIGWTAGGASLIKDAAGYSGVIDDKSITTQVTDVIKDTGAPKVAENAMGVPDSDKAKYGGEQFVEIDEELYRQLISAGANINIIS